MNGSPYVYELPDPALAREYFDIIPVRLGDFSPATGKMHALNVRVTPVMAETILELPLRMQRSKLNSYVKRLANEMRADDFLTDTPVIVGLVTKNTTPEGLASAPAYLLDGQHRLTGIKNSLAAQSFDFVFRVFPDAETMKTYALKLDSGKGRNHHNVAAVAEIDLLLGVGTQDAGAYQKAVRAIMREGLDPTLPFSKEDERDTVKVYEAAKHYLVAGRMLFNLFHFGTLNPITNQSKPLSLDFKASIREVTVFAPLLVWISKNTQLVRSFLTPVILNDQSLIKPIQNTFLEVLRQGLIIKEGRFRSVMGHSPDNNYLKSGNKTQRRKLMATLIMLERFRNPHTRSRKYDMKALADDVLVNVDKVLAHTHREGGRFTGNELDWPSPVQLGEAKNAA